MAEKKEVTLIKGLLTKAKDAVTKTGAPYVVGEVATPTMKEKIKIWDMDLSQLAKMGISVGTVVELTGNPQEFNGERTIIVKKEKDSSQLLIEAIQEDIGQFIYEQPNKPNQMLNSIKGDVSKFCNPVFQTICTTVLDVEGEKLEYYPLPSCNHTEKGGALYHLWGVYCRLVKLVTPTFKQGESPQICHELLKTCAIVESLGFLESAASIDTLTGAVISEDVFLEALFGKTNTALRVKELLTYLSLEGTNEGMALVHCMLSLSDVVEPAIPEAILFKQVSSEESEIYACMENKRGMVPGEIKNNLLHLSF